MVRIRSFNLSPAQARALIAPGLLCFASSCMGIPLGGAGPNPLSVGVSLGAMAASQSIGQGQAAVITPQEQAKYAPLSCTELTDLIGRYETGLTMNQAPKAQGKKGAAIAETAINVRIAYLKNLYASKGCA